MPPVLTLATGDVLLGDGRRAPAAAVVSLRRCNTCFLHKCMSPELEGTTSPPIMHNWYWYCPQVPYYAAVVDPGAAAARRSHYPGYTQGDFLSSYHPDQPGTAVPPPPPSRDMVQSLSPFGVLKDMEGLKEAIRRAKEGSGEIEQLVLSTTFALREQAFTALLSQCGKEKSSKKALEVFNWYGQRTWQWRRLAVPISMFCCRLCCGLL